MSQPHSTQSQRMMLVTTITKSRLPIFSDAACARTAIETLYNIQNHYPFFLYAFVIMHDHCHILLNVPEGGSISKIMHAFKRATAFNIGKGPIWQSRFHIRIIENIDNAIKYIHQNPLRKRLCEYERNYPWSSASGKWDVMELSYT